MSKEVVGNSDADTTDTEKRRPPLAIAAGAFALAGALAGGVTTYAVTLHAAPGPKDIVAVAGTVTCANNLPVTGIWVEPTGDRGRGWARWAPHLEKPNVADFSKAIGAAASSYRVDVGCGGTPKDWLHNDSSPQIPNTPHPVALTCTDEATIKFGTCAIEAAS